MLACIDIIESQEMLKLLKVQDFPNMKQEYRTKLHRDLQNRAYPAILKEEKKALTTAELSVILNQGL